MHKPLQIKNKNYRTTEPDDIDYDAEWAFINDMKAKYSALPDIDYDK